MAFFSCEDPIKPPVVAAKKTGVTLNWNAKWNGNKLGFVSDFYQNTATQPEYMQFLNISMIISKLSLIQDDGTKVLLGDGYQWIDFKKGRTVFPYEIPAGNYKGLSFTLGLDSQVNHGDPNQWSAEHPLNGNLTGMHWGWSGGYIFQAIDGNYKDSVNDKYAKGFSFHTATDPMKREFSLIVGGNAPGIMVVKTGELTSLNLNYYLNRLFTAVELKKGSVSHSEGLKEGVVMQNLLWNLSQFNAFEVPTP